MIMEEDVTDVIQRKIWTVEELIPKVNELTTKAKHLPESAKKNIPVFSDDWSEEGVKKFFEKFKESVRNPLRHKNRELLENRGIQTRDIPEELFDDSTSIQEVVSLFDNLKEFNETITTLLIKKEVLVAWIRESSGSAKENLQEILDAKAGFERIFNSPVEEKIKVELIQGSLVDRSFIASAEDVISKIKSITEYGVSIEYKEGFEEFKTNLDNVFQKLETMQDEYNIPKGEICTLLNGKLLQDAEKLLDKKLKECSEKKIRLLEEWKMYSATLKSIGHDVAATPQGLEELEEAVKNLKTECMNTLGGNGLSLITFLKGEGDFPDEISKDDIKRVLGVLRPMFVRFVREGD